MTDIQTALFALRDPAYQAFQSKLIPTIDPQTVIGVRMPALRKLAREIAGTPVAEDFLQELPHRYYEENNLHGLLISAIPDYDGAVAALETFLPYVGHLRPVEPEGIPEASAGAAETDPPLGGGCAHLYCPLRPGDADELLSG